MRQIIALGGGFSTEPENLALDHYVLAQTGKDKPRVCFLPTASGDSADYIERFYAAFNTLPCAPSHQPLFQSPPRDIPAFLLSQDVIYVGGGNTKNMLAIWRAWGLDEVLRTAWERGIVLAGISAGALCWYEAGVTDSVPGTLSALRCLGFLQGSFSPHYDSEPERRPTFHRLLFQGALGPGVALDDGVALHYVERQLHRVVRSSEGPTAYRLEISQGEVQERRMRAETL
ncbi:MAG: peptidase E [Thermaerobacter sp.]|nr:peptidase E [Thermaerobacter sp.]